jgi:hypothetical protein
MTPLERFLDLYGLPLAGAFAISVLLWNATELNKRLATPTPTTSIEGQQRP